MSEAVCATTVAKTSQNQNSPGLPHSACDLGKALQVLGLQTCSFAAFLMLTHAIPRVCCYMKRHNSYCKWQVEHLKPYKTLACQSSMNPDAVDVTPQPQTLREPYELEPEKKENNVS